MIKKNLVMKAIFCFLLTTIFLEGSPTSLFWTNCCTDVQAPGSLHFGVETYFSLKNRTEKNSTLPTDLGLTYGLCNIEGVKAELGLDYLVSATYPFFFNGKIGVDEEWMFLGSPALNVGLFNVGTCVGQTNQNIVDVIFGKSLPQCIGGRVFVGGYRGSKTLGAVQSGVMAGLSYPIHDKYLVMIDYASGKNAIGGASAGVSYNFTKDVSISTGAVWFFNKKINGNWKWSIFFDINLP